MALAGCKPDPPYCDGSGIVRGSNTETIPELVISVVMECELDVEVMFRRESRGGVRCALTHALSWFGAW